MTMPILQPIPIKTKGLPWWEAILTWMTESRKWRVVEDWFFVLPDGMKIRIRSGFVFDGASVPRFMWGLLSPTGLLLIPGLVHDYAYRYQVLDFGDLPSHALVRMDYAGCSRAFWDRLFRDIAIQVNDFKVINYAAWLALRLFGWVAWNKHRKTKSNG